MAKVVAVVPSDAPSSKPSSNKVIDVTAATAEDCNDPLLKKLKEWDVNGDGHFSPAEVMAAARDLSASEAGRKQAQMMTKRLTFIAGALGFLLFISIGANLASTLFAISLSKEDDVPETSGVMLTRPWNATGDAPPPHPVSTASVKLEVTGLTGLKEATKEELDALEDVSFYHDGGYHRMKAGQVHRYDGRVEVWGLPFGVLIVEDTGEVHYLPYSLPGESMDECWGENSTADSEAKCGEYVDNEPPSNLEVEKPKEVDPEDAPAPLGARRLQAVTENGTEIYEPEDEWQAEARRLSSRRRSGGTARRRVSSSRRRSGGSPSARRRGAGGYSSSGSTPVSSSARRRTTSSITTGPGRRRVPAKADGSSRRRNPDYYGTGTESRRRSVSASTVGAGAGGLAVGAAGGYVAGSAMSGGNSGSNVNVYPSSSGGGYYAGSGGVYTSSHSTVRVEACPGNWHQVCNGVTCWCEEDVSGGVTAWVVCVVIGICCFCCCLGFLGKLASS